MKFSTIYNIIAYMVLVLLLIPFLVPGILLMITIISQDTAYNIINTLIP